MTNSRKTILIFIGTIICLTLLYQFPVQRFLALRKFNRYINEQGIDKQKIVRKEVFKNWKMGGYSILVKYIDDPNKRYLYHYLPWTNRAFEDLRFDRMFLDISNEPPAKRVYPVVRGRCKYPPLKNE